MVQSRCLSDQCTWSRDHCLLFDLGEASTPSPVVIIVKGVPEPIDNSQMNSLAASVKLTYSASMVDRLTDFCLKVRHEIGVSSIKVMNPPIDTRSSLFVAKSESE
ncbi:hypothetical protein TNCV_4599321 [Trichonephila clavipes]|nr:hypothetical protein TNCV_4599321 [Trichonephila clavipes]